MAASVQEGQVSLNVVEFSLNNCDVRGPRPPAKKYADMIRIRNKIMRKKTIC